MIAIAFVNFKGGVTKTSTTVSLGAALARKGYRVLLVDCDPQGHVAAQLGIDKEALSGGLEDILGDRNCSVADVLVESGEKNLMVAPSRRGLFETRSALVNRKGADSLLARALRPVRSDFEFTLIDSPPDEGILSVNAMYASRYIIIPTELKAGSVDGINRVVDNILDLRDAHEEKEWDVLGVLVNKLNEAEKIENRINLATLEEAFVEDNLIFDTKVRVDQTFARGWRYGQSIFTKNPKSKACADFTQLADEVLTRLKLEAKPESKPRIEVMLNEIVTRANHA